jgi:hypothetical protein
MLFFEFTSLNKAESLNEAIGLMWHNSTCFEYPQFWHGFLAKSLNHDLAKTLTCACNDDLCNLSKHFFDL